jgi:glycosyltransferase involved in cell wall biosynthesis
MVKKLTTLFIAAIFTNRDVSAPANFFKSPYLRFMIIAVNTRFLQKGALEGYGYFINETMQRIATQHPEHQFYFLFDRPYDESFVFSPNVTGIIVSPPARHPVLWKWWYDVKIPLLLKKLRADVFLSPDGFCSLTTRVPQCLVIHDLGFLRYPQGYTRSHLFFYKRYTPRFLGRAKRIATVSNFSKKDMVATYGLPESKITVVYNGVREVFQPTSFEEQMLVREKYTGGAGYFISVGAIHPRKNLITLLKAFSQFKKKQRSQMKLVLAGRLAWKNDAFLELLKTYRYRTDVVLLNYIEDEQELARLVAAAYALVYPSYFEGFGVPVAEAMQCGVPVLTSKDSAMQEISEGAALYFDPSDAADLAACLIRIYKDEPLRTELVTEGKAVAQKYTWQHTADALWQCMMQTAKR